MDLRGKSEGSAAANEANANEQAEDPVNSDRSMKFSQREYQDEEIQRLRTENESLRNKIENFEKVLSTIQGALKDISMSE